MTGFDYGNYTNKADANVYSLQGNNQKINLTQTEKEQSKPLLNFNLNQDTSVKKNGLDAYANYNIGGLNFGKKIDLSELPFDESADTITKMVAKFVTPAQQERIIAGVQSRDDFYVNKFSA